MQRSTTVPHFLAIHQNGRTVPKPLLTAYKLSPSKQGHCPATFGQRGAVSLTCPEPCVSGKALVLLTTARCRCATYVITLSTLMSV